MTNQEAIQAEALNYWNVRRNVDGSRNGNAVYGIHKRLRRVFRENGASHNEAITMAYDAERQFRADMGA